MLTKPLRSCFVHYRQTDKSNTTIKTKRGHETTHGSSSCLAPVVAPAVKMARRQLQMGLARTAQRNTSTITDSTPRSTSRSTSLVSESVSPLEPRSVGNGNSPDDRATNRFDVYRCLHINMLM